LDSHFFDSEAEKDLFITLYEQYRCRMLYIAYKILGDRGKAEDVIQDAFIKVAAYMKKYRLTPSKSTQNLIITIVKHEAIDELRRQTRRSEISYDDTMMEDQLSDQADQALDSMKIQEEYDRIFQYVEQLNEKYRLVFKMKYLSDLSYEEIVTALGIDPATAHMRIYRARQLLQKMLAQGQTVSGAWRAALRLWQKSLSNGAFPIDFAPKSSIMKGRSKEEEAR
jgi:RNA polymerase sigma-70 factor (ECF subfamily)